VYEVYLESSAERDLKNLPSKIFDSIINQIKGLSENPRPLNCRKITNSKNDWRIRIGKYRVIYEIDEKYKAVKIMKIRHRKDVYR